MSIDAVSIPWESEEDFAAEMTNRQFAALQARLRKRELLAELAALPFVSQIQRSNSYSFDYVRARLANGWNTEYLLKLGQQSYEGDDLVYALQWAFPQAYYAAFSVTVAFLSCIGYTDTSHSAVLKRVGTLINQGKYPARIGFGASGGKDIQFIGIAKSPARSTLTFKPDDPASVDTQICQFLKGTRERDLKDKRDRMSFKSPEGKRKKKWTRAEWEMVSTSLGVTSILSLLYRKRIKANYKEIDTFLSKVIKPQLIYGALVHIVACANIVHEAFIRRAVGKREYDRLCETANSKGRVFVVRRTKELEKVFG